VLLATLLIACATATAEAANDPAPTVTLPRESRVPGGVAIVPLATESEDPGTVEIALARSGGTDADGLVGEANVQRVAVGLGIDGDRAQAEPAGGADDAAGDFAAIGDQDALEHGGPHILKMP
jgi:hypothetical protein